MRLKKYPALDYAAIELDCCDAVPVMDESSVRLSIPTGYREQIEFIQSGYMLADRTIEVKVSVKKNKTDFQKFCRMPVEFAPSKKEEVFKLAKKSFNGDHRFRVNFDLHDEKIYEGLLRQWVEEQTDIFICNYKDILAGFADIRFPEEYSGAPFVYLAAVDDTYRTSGAAMSLYASVFQHMKEKGYHYVYGRISSKNMAVMNLYASFGAVFAKPYDIYIKYRGDINA